MEPPTYATELLQADTLAQIPLPGVEILLVLVVELVAGGVVGDGVDGLLPAHALTIRCYIIRLDWGKRSNRGIVKIRTCAPFTSWAVHRSARREELGLPDITSRKKKRQRASEKNQRRKK